MSSRPDQLPTTGVRIVEGLPGSGKSFFLTLRMVETILQQRRPVYTNLPLRWRVVRQYLRNHGGSRLANLVHPLDHDGFARFVERIEAKKHFREARRADFRTQAASFEEVEAEFAAEHGPDVVDGPDLNWIPEAALIIIDEAHEWYPMQRQATEPIEVMRYLARHRHMLHWLWVATQERVRLSKTFRVYANEYWMVRDKAQDTVAWGIRFRHIGLRAIGYSAFTGDQVENRSLDNKKPLANYVVFPWFPTHRWVFRLYDSFTHVGNRRQLLKRLQRSREQAGLSASGEDDGAVHTKKEVEPMRRMLRRRSFRFVVVGFVFMLGLALGALKSPPQTKPDEVAATPVVPPPFEWGQWEGTGRDYIRVDGRRYFVGDRYKGRARLDYLSIRPRRTLWQLGDNVWLWDYGRDPRILGTVDQIEDRLIALIGSDGPPASE